MIRSASPKLDDTVLDALEQRLLRRITPELIDQFAELMRKRLREGEPGLRQYYVRSIVGRVEVGDAELKIVGATKALEHAMGRVGSQPHIPVPNIEREWRARQDSNLWPQD